MPAGDQQAGMSSRELMFGHRPSFSILQCVLGVRKPGCALQALTDRGGPIYRSYTATKWPLKPSTGKRCFICNSENFRDDVALVGLQTNELWGGHELSSSATDLPSSGARWRQLTRALLEGRSFSAYVSGAQMSSAKERRRRAAFRWAGSAGAARSACGPA